MPPLQCYPQKFPYMASRTVSPRSTCNLATFRLTIFQYSGRSYRIKCKLLLPHPHIPHQILTLTIIFSCLCNWAYHCLCSSLCLESPLPLATWETVVHSEPQFRCSLMCKIFCHSLGELRGDLLKISSHLLKMTYYIPIISSISS